MLAANNDKHMITKDELELKRSPEDLSIYVDATFESIRSDQNEKELARLKKPPYKEFIEEVYPLSIFCKLKYQKCAVKCYPVIGNQAYDAVIESNSGELLEVVELTWPIDGQKAHFKAKQLNEKGRTDVEVRDVNDNTVTNKIIEHVIETANKKALKDYKTPGGSSLVFILDISPYFGMHRVEKTEEIEILKVKLREIEYKVNSVYILLLPINELIEIK